MASSGAKGCCPLGSALNKSPLSIAFVPWPALFSKIIKIGCSCTCQMAPRCAGWACCARVWISGPAGLVFCVLLLAILAVSAVLPRGGSVQIGRRLELVVLDLSLICILESVVEFLEETEKHDATSCCNFFFFFKWTLYLFLIWLLDCLYWEEFLNGYQNDKINEDFLREPVFVGGNVTDCFVSGAISNQSMV